MSAMTWSPEQYERFKAERKQPFLDLLALVESGRACAWSTSAAARAS